MKAPQSLKMKQWKHHKV